MKTSIIVGTLALAGLGIVSAANCARVAGEIDQAQVTERTDAADLARKRELYLRQHPETREPIARAIREGKLTTGMWVQEAQAAIGKLERKTGSNGAGGKSETWIRRDGGSVTILHFTDDALDRWTTPNG